MTDNLKIIYQEIEDLLFPQLNLDVFERSLYYYLLRFTRLQGRESGTFPLSDFVNALNISEFKAREAIRSLDSKGCISLTRSRKGHIVKVLLPEELGLHAQHEEKEEVDIESIDFYKDSTYLSSLLAREQGRCFYCLKEVTKKTCELDHASPQVDGVDNSYRNIVVSCHDCNTKKQGTDAENFLRSLYRKGLLSDNELEERLEIIESLRAGKLVPEI